MSHKQVFQSVIAVILIMSFLVGCGGSAPTAVSEAPAATSTPEQSAATPTPEPPTATPTATPTPEPPTATPTPSGPKVGHWEGEPSISFDVTTDGNIDNFKAIIPMSNGECTFDLGETTIEEDNTFTLPNLIAYNKIANSPYLSALEELNGKPEIIETDSGKMFVGQRINGKFDDTDSVTGIVKIWICIGEGFMADKGAGTEGFKWNAEWKKP